MKGSSALRNRQSLGIYREETATNGSTIIKDQSKLQNGNALCKFKDEPKEVDETNESIAIEVNAKLNMIVHS